MKKLCSACHVTSSYVIDLWRCKGVCCHIFKDNAFVLVLLTKDGRAEAKKKKNTMYFKLVIDTIKIN